MMTTAQAQQPSQTDAEDREGKALAGPVGDAANHTRIMDGGERSERLAGDPPALDRC